MPTPQQTPAPVCSQPSAICGRVTTTAGQPLAGVYVEAYQISVDRKYGTCTDASGSYLIQVEAYPTYRVKFVVEGTAGTRCKSASIRSPAGSITRWWQDTIDASTVTFVSVSTAGAGGIDMVIPPIVTITGRVTDKVTGVAIPGVSIALWPQRTGISSSTPYSGASTDASGAYIVAGFAGEQRPLFIRGGTSGSQNWTTVQDLSGAVCSKDAPTLLVPPAGLSNFNVALPPLFAVSGRITDRITGAAVSGTILVTPYDANSFLPAPTD
ncbi:MAG: carboxypeptidase regulatory-like domain-containing protein [Parcubacteria group bacterium]|nr:carboxypeptidase regulatory-like domain-containing protein [Parcubacteria group bacterium]